MVVVDLIYDISFGAFVYAAFLMYILSKVCLCEKRQKPEFGPFPRDYYRFQEIYVWFWLKLHSC